MGNLQVAKVQKCITLNHTEGFPTHMARQRHYFSKCVMEQKKRKAKGRSESRRGGGSAGRGGDRDCEARAVRGADSAPSLPAWLLPKLKGRSQRQKYIFQERKEMLLESRASKALIEMKYWEKPDFRCVAL